MDKKISLKIRLAVAIPVLIVSAFVIIRNIGAVFPSDPMKRLQSDIVELPSADLEEQDKLMDGIYKCCIDLCDKSVFAESPIREVVGERYNAFVSSGKPLGEHDFGILLHGMLALKAMGPLTKETLDLIVPMATNKTAREIDSSYESIAGFAMQIAAKNRLLETEQTLERFQNIPRDPIADDMKKKVEQEH